MQRRQLIESAATVVVAGLAFQSRAQSSAQAFPGRPLKLIVAFPAGGPTDITMRVLADNASKILSQPVVIENKPGAGGTLPAQALQSTPADGYTLAQIPLGVFRLPYTTKITWDPIKDLAYVLNVTGYAFGLVVPADSPLKTWTLFAFLRHVRQSPTGMPGGMFPSFGQSLTFAGFRRTGARSAREAVR